MATGLEHDNHKNLYSLARDTERLAAKSIIDAIEPALRANSATTPHPSRKVLINRHRDACKTLLGDTPGDALHFSLLTTYGSHNTGLPTS